MGQTKGPEGDPGIREKPAGAILVFKESPAERKAIRRTLERRFPAYQVLEAGDGFSALVKMTRGQVALIIMDLQAPNSDGITFLKMIRENPVLHKKPVVILSNDFSPAVIAEVKEDEFVRLLAKPAKAPEIAEAVATFL